MSKMLPINPVAVILSTQLLIGFGLCLADQVDNYVLRQMQREHIPGLSLAVVKDGRIIKARGYGLANVELNVPARKETVYEIGSMTKQFTATAIMILVQEGKLGLEDKITNHLSHLPEAWNEVTVRHLLTHTSGIKGYLSVPDAMAQTVSPISISSIIGMLAPYPLEFTPGERHVYSNTGYYLLGCIIENVSQRKYADFLKERVFSPLGMNATAVNDLKAVITNRASGYSWRDGRLRRSEYMDMSWPFAAGALVSTVEDMARWDAALYTERVLPKSTLEQMWTPVKLSNGSNYSYGFGWYVFDYKGHRLLAHSGGIPGFASCIGRWVDDRVTVIIMLNSDGGRAYLEYLLTQGVARRYIPSLVGKPIGTSPRQTW